MINFSIIRNIAGKVVNGTATEEEISLLTQFLSNTDDSLNQEILFDATEWDNQDRNDREYLPLSHQEKEAMLSLILGSSVKEPANPNLKRMRMVWLAAASLFLLIAGYSLLKYEHRRSNSPLNNTYNTEAAKFNTEATKFGQRKIFFLPDSSKIFLNAGSEIRYPIKFGDSLREIYLQGEAFFEVAKDDLRPFVIHSGHLITRILGTSLNVRSYPGEARTRVDVRTGKVRVSIDDGGRQSVINGLVLLPSQEAVYSSVGDRSVGDRSLIRRTVVNDGIGEWTRNKLFFEDKTLSEILRELERIYDVHFNTRNEKALSRHYTFRVDKMSIDSTLETISALTKLTFDRKNSHILVK